jgi:uncharacterized protein YndB with AHSA1/START domain
MKSSGKLKLTTQGNREIVLTRVFDAPRRLVIEAMTRPELLKCWLLGPPGWTMVECEIDLKVGGTYRHLWRNTDGTEMCMHGVYREIELPGRFVRTEASSSAAHRKPASSWSRLFWSNRMGKRRSRSRCYTPPRKPAMA